MHAKAAFWRFCSFDKTFENAALLQENGFLILKPHNSGSYLIIAGAEPPTPALASQEAVGTVQSLYGLFSHFPASFLSSAAPETDLCQPIYSAHISTNRFFFDCCYFYFSIISCLCAENSISKQYCDRKILRSKCVNWL